MKKKGQCCDQCRRKLRSLRHHVTDIERTIIDSIKDFPKIGGLEELLRCLDMVTVVDEKKLATYLASCSNQFLYQKTGYILSHFKKMKFPVSFSTCASPTRKKPGNCTLSGTPWKRFSV